MSNLEIYIHIPFCVKKCRYCDFLSFAADEETKQKYVDALCLEISRSKEKYAEYDITTIYMGGGTPSALSCEQLCKIGASLKEVFKLKGLKAAKKIPLSRKRALEKNENMPDIEFSAEANPGTLSKEKLKALRQMGVNRLSLGLQSSVNAELKQLGRIHTYEDFTESFFAAREAGFNNINVDLLEAIPLQTLPSFKKTLANVISLRPEHVSAYSLIIEEGTPFYEKMNSSFPLALPDEDEEREIYYAAGELLSRAGYEQYEISNYALPLKACRHNTGYWRRENYLGLGLGASSMVENIRWKNTSDMEFYLEGCRQGADIRQEIHKLSYKEQMEEFMFLGLRMNTGISKTQFFETFKADFGFVYGETAAKLMEQGLLEEDEERVYLTKRGVDVSSRVLAQFLL